MISFLPHVWETMTTNTLRNKNLHYLHLTKVQGVYPQELPLQPANRINAFHLFDLL